MMKQPIWRTVTQACMILIVSTAVALAVNSARSRGLDLGRNYFAAAKPSIHVVKPVEHDPPVTPPADVKKTLPDGGSHGAGADSSQVIQPAESPAKGGTEYPMGEFGFREITTPQVRQLLDDPRVATQGILFVDARNETNYKAGRIPGAVQLDHYYKDQFMPEVLPMAMNAELIVVYCLGGDCEDSLMACNDLMLEGVPQENILLYKGGYKEWSDAGHPTEADANE